MTKIRKQFIWGLIFLLTGSVAQADVVTMLNGSQGGHNWGTQASYTSGGNTVYYWSNHEVVTAGNDYYVSGKGLRTPDTGNNETFPGDALYMGYSGVETVGSGSSLVIKSTGVTINNLNYYGGTITNAKAQHATVTLYGALSTAGNITLASNGDTNSKIGDARTLVINSTITGASNFTISTSTIPYTGLTKNSSVQITGDNSNFSGSWTVNSGAYFYANSATALGTGSVANNGNMYVTVASDYSTGKAWTNNATGVLNLSADTTVSSLTNKNGGKINLTSGADLTVGALTVNYASTGSAVDFVLPNQTTAITTQGQKDALAVVGISVADNNSTLKVTGGARDAKTWYLSSEPAESVSWDGNCWTSTEGGAAEAGIIPTFGDTAVITRTLRTKTQDSAGTTQFLATMRVDPSGTLSLKNNNGAIVYIPDLILNGGSIFNGKANGATNILDGNILVQADSKIGLGATAENNRHIRILSNISGNKNLTVSGTSSASNPCNLYLEGDNSGYTGQITVSANCILNSVTDQSTVHSSIVLTSGSKLVGTNGLSIGQVTYKDALNYGFTFGNQTTALTAQQQAALSKAANIVVSGDNPTLKVNDSNRAAGNYYIINSLGLGNNWSTLAYYTTTDGGTAQAGYVPSFGDTLTIRSGKSLRTPETTGTGMVSFLAKTILEGELNLKSASSNIDIYMPFLEMNGGTINHGQGGLIQNLSGNINVVKQSTISLYQDGDSTRILNLNSDVSGSANLVLKGAVKDGITTTKENSFTLGGDNSQYTGKFILQGLATVNTKANNALGQTGAELQGTSSLNIGAGFTEDINSLTFSGTQNTLTINGELAVDQITKTAAAAQPTFTFGEAGVLKVGQVGTADVPVNFTQNAGTFELLNPGETNIYGDFAQTGGVLSMDIYTQSLNITGDAVFSELALTSSDPNFEFDANQTYLAGITDVTGTVTFLNALGSLSAGGTDYSVLFFQKDGSVYYGSTSSVPEPSTWLLLTVGLAGLVYWRRKK